MFRVAQGRRAGRIFCRALRSNNANQHNNTSESKAMGGPPNQLHGFMMERRRTPQQRATDRSTLAQLARQTVAIVLAGGRGSRLGPLTEWRAKPAVPFGGKFKIID